MVTEPSTLLGLCAGLVSVNLETRPLQHNISLPYLKSSYIVRGGSFLRSRIDPFFENIFYPDNYGMVMKAREKWKCARILLPRSRSNRYNNCK